MTLRLLHISDLHFGPPYHEPAGEALLRIAPELAADAVIASGDFTQRAKPHQFDEAKAYIDRLPDVPIITTPGNHDVPLYRVFERFLDPHGQYRRAIHDELEFVVHLPGATIVSLDSTSPRRAISNGRIHKDQLEFCEEAFRGADKDDVKIVVSHHHFAPAPDFERDQTLPKAKRAIDRFTEIGVDMILGGHLHRAYIGNSLDIYPGSDREHGIIIVQCGTTTSRRGRGKEREKNSFNVIEAGEGVFTITHYVYSDAAGVFAPASRHMFPRPGAAFAELPPQAAAV